MELNLSSPKCPRSLAQHTRTFSVVQRLPQSLVLGLVAALVLHIITGLSREGTNFLLAALSAIVATTYSTCTQVFGIKNAEDKRIPSARDWPFDIRTAIAHFHLEPDLIHYACCPQCFALYAPDGAQGYPRKCTNRKFEEGEECGTPVMATTETPGAGNLASRPIRTFAYQPFTSWLARLLARPGLVELLRVNATGAQRSHPELISDIFQGDAAKKLVGSDGKPFLENSPGELRLIFNMNVDWFNPYGSRKSGRQYSVGGIYLICMNLPIHLRYQVRHIVISCFAAKNLGSRQKTYIL